MSKLLEDIKDQYEKGIPLSSTAIEWLIEQAELAEKYEEAFKKVIS